MPSLGDHASALRFALRAPGIVTTEMEPLMTWNAEWLPAHATRDIARVRRHADIALRWLSRLSRVWGTPWRNTCLFRSITECVVLRAHGYRARIVIGVARACDPQPDGGDVRARRPIIAHAWVECEDIVCACSEGERTYRPLLTKAESP